MKSTLSDDQAEALVYIIKNHLEKNKKTYGDKAAVVDHYETTKPPDFCVKVEDLNLNTSKIFNTFSIPGFAFHINDVKDPVYDCRSSNTFFSIRKKKSNWLFYIGIIWFLCTLLTTFVCFVLIMAHTRNEEDPLRPLKHIAQTSYLYTALLHLVQIFRRWIGL
jgi:hypothetical protein